MNIEIARQRYKDVFLPDVIDNSQGDFLSKHVQMKNLFYVDHSELTEQDKKNPLTEEDIYDRVFSGKEDDQFVLVKGASGAGKSHLIRWLESMLKIRKSDNEIILYIKRADNTLKGTIRQLIDLNEIKNLPNRELYKKLASASTTVPELELKNTIYYEFINLIESDDGRGGEDEERIINRVDRIHLIALLQNSIFKDRLMDTNGPIDRIYNKIAENKTFETNDKAAEFEAADFEIDSAFRNALISAGADEKARKIADKMLDNEDFVGKLVVYINKFRERVIQRCTGLEPGDLRTVIEEIRQELYKVGKNLTILIEDITAASGVDDSLLDALLTNRKGYSDKKLCRINSIVGVADGYYDENFRSNTKGRIKNFIIVPNEMFNGDEDGLVEFFARYLNTVSLDVAVINSWIGNKASAEGYPIHEVTIGKDWDVYKLNDKNINLFPFTKHAISYLYRSLDENQRNPRALMRLLIEPYVTDAIEDLSHYPLKRNTLVGIDPKLQNLIYNRSDFSDDEKIRLSQFMYIWGDGTTNIYEENGIRYIAGITESVYSDLNLPTIDGEVSERPKEKKSITEKKRVSTPIQNTKDNEQVLIALKEVDYWIEHKDYKLSIGATTKNVRALNAARKNINAFLYNVIDWNAEGVSIDAVVKVRETSNKFLVAFERQTQNSDAVVLLPASIESRKIIEAFVRWSEEGNNSWAFPNGTDYLYRVQKWTESIKPTIVKSILHYEDKTADYFSYAVAAEFYHLIFNGSCKNFQSATNFNADILLKKKEPIKYDNAHTKSWNDLLKKMNGKDADDIRNCVLQYYNLPQGTSITTSNFELDYVAFVEAVKRVINTGLVYSDEELQLDDPVKKRRLFSEYLKKIIERVPQVVAEEKTEIKEKFIVIEELLDLDEVEDEENIKEIVKSIKKFYNRAQSSHIVAAIHMDNELLQLCTKNANSIYASLKNGRQALESESDVEALIRISKDPLSGLSPLAEMLSKAKADLDNSNQEIDSRLQNTDGTEHDDESEEYKIEKQDLEECREILEEVRNKNAAR